MSHEKLTHELVNELMEASTTTETTRAEFQSLFSRAATALELEPNDLARMMRTSRPTIERWLSGASAPHWMGRPSVFGILFRCARARRLKSAVDGAEQGNLYPRPDKSR